MSSADRMECPNCRQSIKRPALPAGSKCLCPKCNQPFTVGGEAAVAAAPAKPVPSAPVAAAPTPATAPAPVIKKPAAAAPQAPSPTPPPQAMAVTPTQQPAAPRPAPSPQPAASPQPVAHLNIDDDLPDENPPPAKGKKQAPAKPNEFRFHCFLCGSLLYAREDQIGGTIQCHDCHSPNEVRPPKAQDWQKASDGPSLDDAEEFALSPTFERPKFEPIEKPKPPEEDEDSDFSIKPLPVTPTQTVAGSPGAGAVPAPSQFAPQPAPNPAPPRPAPVRTHEDTYGDELWNDPGDNGRPAFERSPFLVGIVEFLFYPGTLPRWLALTALACLPIACIEMVFARSNGMVLSGSAGFFAAVFGIPWLAIFGAHAMSIVRDTAQGRDNIEDWPLGGFLPHGNPLFLPVAAAAAAAPGATYYLISSGEASWGLILILVSLMLLLPLTWLPMLLEKSLQGPMQSQTFWQSFRCSANGWIVFFVEVLLLSLVGAGGISLFTYGSLVVAPLAAVVVITPLFLYFRLLGRMLWFIDPAMAPPPPPAKPGPPPLPETVDPSQVRQWR